MSVALSLSLALFIALSILKLVSSSPGPHLPPGPPPLPILGNLLDWPFHSGWLKFAEWTKKYGDLVHIQIFGVHIIIIGRLEIAQRLLNQGIYSDRPRLPMVGELMGFAPSMVLAPYGEHWRAMRKLTARFLSKSMDVLWPSILSDSRLLLRALGESPDDHASAIRFALGKNIVESTYGITIDGPSDQFILLSQQTHETIQHAVVPGTFLVDIFPILKYVPSWLPGAGFKRLAHLANSRRHNMVNAPFQISKAMLDESSHAMVPALLTDPHLLPRTGQAGRAEMEHQIKWAAASLYGAGVESSTSALSTFLFMMATHSEIQHKAQSFIDAITGGTRLPTKEDFKHLPYIEAIMKETLRFHPPSPLGIAHRLTQEDIYEGYRLPEGAIVIANIWGMNRDARYFNPNEFVPERFLGTDSIAAEPDPTASVFGFGRRACLGVQYTTAVLSINMVSILAAFSISAEDPAVRPSFSGGFVSHVHSIPYIIRPRSTVMEELIRGELESSTH
ncbi:cytochrome P450 [Mycena filopes]|nr:cytochrome P450 [Mycena filopes]